MFNDNKSYEFYVLLTVGNQYLKKNEEGLWVLTYSMDKAYSFDNPKKALNLIHKIAIEKNLDLKSLKIIAKETRWEVFTLPHENVLDWEKL